MKLAVLFDKFATAPFVSLRAFFISISLNVTLDIGLSILNNECPFALIVPLSASEILYIVKIDS